ncbi:ABC transporter ATP-binding protein [Varunaivibrio sulfuroxidans]|uniref:Dipeptide transport system ATP-binding protein n=1 Tax=Varunaivibrio sulfuroxidans TaxID=1773489 RepID=A0A4R3JDE3_9PROT|nr:ABC transporter ATP-binding protein [Varunaivibrio sulfuroxidans]TCS63425.1 dipeptide transport system ATP-binding protein [Varunaivibrio sulfuroxidans]WES30429.1 ABC transporter ATP-binding protein [Varunaivibrio sulfuroxidans]
MSLLDIKNLRISFGDFVAVDGIDIRLDEGEVLAIVGESGSGKSVAMMAVMGLLPWTAKIEAERMAFDGIDLRAMPAGQRRRVIGKDMAMIFQEPMTSLNPCFTVGYQIKEAMKVHLGLGGAKLHARAIEMLERVGIPAPERRLKAFPHQMSGGMSQRVMIAMSLSCSPRLLIADEPTTALDVTIQAQILDLLVDLQRSEGMAMVLITHDMAVVAETAKRMVIQYAGQQVEEGDVAALFQAPRHPYTSALLDALPERSHGKRLNAIPGVVPGQYDRPTGCLFNPRCAFAQAKCRNEAPPYENDVRCHFALKSAPLSEPAS